MTDLSQQAHSEARLPLVPAEPPFQRAFGESAVFFSMSRVWQALAIEDIRAKYRRTALGPWWSSVTYCGMGLMMALVSGNFLGSKMQVYLPHFMLSIVLWSFLSSSILESTHLIVQSTGTIRSTSIPLACHIMRMLHRNMLLFWHNFAVVPVLWLVIQWSVDWDVLLVLPGLVLNYVFAASLATILALVCVRYRDVPPLVQAGMQLMFFISPIIWMPGQVHGGRWALALNPFNYMISVVHDPLLGLPFDPLMWIGATTITVLAFIVAAMVYARYHRRVIFWV